MTAEIEKYFDPERRRLALAYRRYRYSGMLMSLLYDALFMLWLVWGLGDGLVLRVSEMLLVRGFGGLAPSAARSTLLYQVLRSAVWGMLVLAAYVAGATPISYVAGYLWPRRFGLVHHSLGQWVRDRVTSLLLGMPVAAVAAGLVQWLMLVRPLDWWLVISAMAWGFSVLVTCIAPVLLMPLYNRFWPMPEGDLRSDLIQMASRAGTSIEGVYVMDMSRRTSTANAMLTGLLGTRRMVVGDTLLYEFPEDEVKVVMAHELAHHRHGHIPKSLALSALALPVLFGVSARLASWASLQLRAGLAVQPNLPGSEHIGLFVASIWAINTLAAPVTSWLSRYFEWQADESALAITRDPEAFARTMARLYDGALGDTAPPWIVKTWCYSHPPVVERIEHALKWRELGSP